MIERYGQSAGQQIIEDLYVDVCELVFRNWLTEEIDVVNIHYKSF